MDKIKLTYFNFNGGRGEATRIAMSMAGIDFEDHRISFEEFGKMRSCTPLNAVPVIEINGEAYTQSNAMNRYFGKQAGLYPSDDWEAFKCDEIMDAIEDVMHMTVRTFGLKGDELANARKALVDNTLIHYLKFIDKRLDAAGGKYLAGNQLTVADLKAFLQLRSLKAGTLDHVPTDLIDIHAPRLLDYTKRIEAEPGVVEYYARINAA